MAPRSLNDVFEGYFAISQSTGCVGCHGTGVGNLTFKTAEDLWQATVGKPSHENPSTLLVAPGDPAHSYLYQKLLPSAAPRMPSNGPPYLDDVALAAVAGWICAGAPEPSQVTEDGGVDGGSDGGTTDGGAQAPGIVDFSPASGVVGTPVTIQGTGFSATAADDLVAFGGVAATVSSASTTSIVAAVPSGAATGKISVAVNGLTAVSASDFQVIVPNPVPTLSAISPSTALVGSGDVTLSLSGTGFVSVSTAELDGTVISSTYQSATSLTAIVPAADLIAGSHTIAVVNPSPGGGTSAGISFAVDDPAPVISSLSPSSVVAGSGAFTLTIAGSGFIAGSQVSLNGAAAAPSSISASSIAVTVPASAIAAVGAVSVVVTNPSPGGGSSAPVSLAVVNPTPVLSGISPSSVTAGSGAATLILSGSGFIPTSQVQLDGASLTTTFASGTQLSADVSAAITAVGGTHRIAVVSPSPGGGTSAAATFTVDNPVPTLASISPSSVATGGAPFALTVTGTGFNASSVVNFNGAAVSTTFVSATTIKGQIPSISAPGSYPATVTNPAPGGGTSSVVSLTAATSTSPTITGLSPASTAANAAFTLTITGSGYVCSGNPSQVLFGATTLAASSCSSTQLMVSVPATTAGTYSVQVKNPATGLTSNTVSFDVVNPNPVPTLSSLSPSSAIAGGSAFTLTVNGSNFVSGAQVSFNGSARTTAFVSATQVTASILASDIVTAGSYPVAVTNPTPGGGTSSSLSFSVVAANPVPSISSLSPSSVGAGSGAVSVTLSGTGFISSSSATFNGSARTTTFVSSTQLAVALTASDTQTAGSYPIAVTNPAPGGGTSSGFTFNVVTQNPVPVLSSISPTSALAGGAGFTLTVNGSSFVSNSSVLFNGVAKVTTFGSATQLTASIAASDVAATGSYPVTVTNPTPGGGTSSAISLQVDNPAPSISSISPSTVSVGSGAFSLTVNGSGFVGSSTVDVDGSARTTHYVSATQITADLTSSDDAASGTHTITAINPTPGGGTSAGATLSVVQSNPVPSISSLSPCGAVAGGATFPLTINGASFVSGATATFNGTSVTVTFVSSTQIAASIPSSLIATAPAGNVAPVIVTNPTPGGGASNTADFGVASAAVTLSNVQSSIFTPSCATAGCHVTGGPAPMSLQSGQSYGNLVGVTSSQCAPTLRVLACGPLTTQSYLIAKILNSNICSGTQMPKAAPLSSSEKQMIVNWVAEGAPNN